MKNLIKGLALSFSLISTLTFAEGTGEKKIATIKNVLPESIPSIETPAAPKVNTVQNQTQYTAEQKAAIVELKLSSVEKGK